MIKSRFLTKLGVFESKTTFKDQNGESNSVWVPIVTKYVDVRPISVDVETETETSYQIARLELSVRYSSSLESQVKTGDRVLIENKPYLIEQLGDVLSRKKLTYIIYRYE